MTDRAEKALSDAAERLDAAMQKARQEADAEKTSHLLAQVQSFEQLQAERRIADEAKQSAEREAAGRQKAEEREAAAVAEGLQRTAALADSNSEALALASQSTRDASTLAELRDALGAAHAQISLEKQGAKSVSDALELSEGASRHLVDRVEELKKAAAEQEAQMAERERQLERRRSRMDCEERDRTTALERAVAARAEAERQLEETKTSMAAKGRAIEDAAAQREREAEGRLRKKYEGWKANYLDEAVRKRLSSMPAQVT